MLAVPAGCGPTQRPDGGHGLLAVGSPSPRLSDTTHDGKTIAIGTADTPITLVYFYPKDATPGCTREACAFRDAWDRFEQANVMVIGVSGDDDVSHQSFSSEHQLPFPLVSDTDSTWATAFGVPTTAGMPKRVSFLIDGTGKVAKVYDDVDPAVHADDVLSDVAKLGK